MKMTSKEFRAEMNAIRDKIFSRIIEVMGEIGDKVCVRMYHDYNLISNLYTFCMVNRDGYGVVLHLDMVSTGDDIEIVLTDYDDCYEETLELWDLSTTDALYLLEELEEIADFHKNNPDKEVLTEYDADFDWENY